MAKTKDIKRRVGNQPTMYEIPESALPGGREPGPWEPGVRNANTVGTKQTGDVRQGNTPTPAANFDINDAPGRHTSNGKIEFTSENFPTRENAVQTGETFSGDGGQFEFSGTPESHVNLQRERVPRQQVEDAKSRPGRAIKNEKNQRGSNPRNQR